MTTSIKQLLFLFGCLFSLTSLGQTHLKTEADSLRAELERDDLHDTTRISYTSMLGEKELIFRIGYWDTVAVMTEEAFLRHGDTTVLKRLALSYSVIMNNLGYLYNSTGKIDTALVYYGRCMDMKEKLNDQKGKSLALNNLGALNAEIENYEIALDYFEQSLAIREELEDLYGMAQCYNNIGVVLDDMGATPEVELEYYMKGLNLRLELDDVHGIALGYNNVANWHEDHGSIDSAHYYYDLALAKYEEGNNVKGISQVTGNIAGLLIDEGLFAQAKPFALKSHELSVKLGFPLRIKNSAYRMYLIYEHQDNSAQALEMYLLFDKMEDSLYNLDNVKATTRQQIQYEYDMKIVADSIQNIENEKLEQAKFEKLEAQNAQKEQQSYFLYGGLALTLVFGIFMYRRFQLTNKQKVIIEEQKEQVDLAFVQLEEKNNEIMDSISYAKRIQSAILPPDKMVKEQLKDSFILYKPKDIVAGDFYWMEQTKDNLLFAAADCTGHGVPGAMVSVVCNNGLNRSVREHNLTEPAKVLDKTREIVIQEFEKSEEEVKDGMDIALCGLNGNKLSFAGAHNPLWIIRKGANEIEEFKGNKQPIGKFDKMEPFKGHETTLNKGDTFYIFSDGYADQFGGEKGKKFKAANLKKLLLSIQNLSMINQKEEIDSQFENWKGSLEQLDDVCIIGVRY